MRRYRKLFIFIIILFIAIFLRLWQLGSVPISPDWDEAALGYNAYSILHTGRDEYGQFLPVVFRSFDDYKPGLYIYLSIPSIAVFGLSTFAVRLPSAIAGISTVIIAFFLVRELFTSYIKTTFNSTNLAFVVMSLLAISPWHLQFSRIAFEANIGLCFNVLGVYLFLLALRKPWLLSLTWLSFILSMYAYQSEKVFTPLIFLSLMVIFRKIVWRLPKKYLIVSACIALIALIPLINFSFTNKEAFARAKGVSIFSKSTELLANTTKKVEQDKKRNDIAGLFLHNWRLEYGRIILSNYLAHFNPIWIFIKGDYQNNRHHAPDMGLEYLVLMPFILIGIYQLIFEKFDNKIKLVIFSWFLFSPIPASITIDVPHAVRTLNMLPTLQIFSALGIITVYLYLSKLFRKELKQKVFSFSIFIIIILAFPFNFIYYLDQYFVQQNYFYAYDWQYGYENVIEHLKPIKNNYKKILVSNRGSMTQSYMFFLFYLQYDPKKYLQNGGTGSGGFATMSNSFANFEFRTFDYYKEPPETLFVGSPADFPEVFQTIHLVRYPNGDEAIRVVKK